MSNVIDYTHGIRHMLWSKAVGTDGYVKSEWMELEKSVMKILSEWDKAIKDLQLMDRMLEEINADTREILRHSEASPSR